jgi:hypothetical protein
MSRTACGARRGGLAAVAVLGLALSLGGCGAARSVSGSPATSAGATADPTADPTTDTPSGAGTPVTPAPASIRQDDLDELSEALSDGSALTTEVESDMAKDST